MLEVLRDAFTCIGAITSAALVSFLFIVLCGGIVTWIEKLKHRYQYKHRFDKPPTAKCYCIDCVHHDNKTGLCYRFGEEYRCTADNWFCWEAEPREKGE